MSSSFSIQRVFLLIQKQWIENSRFYLLALLAIPVIIVMAVTIFFLQIPGSRYSEEALFQVYFYGLFIIGALLASRSFSSLGDKEKGLYWLGAPASQTEKLTCSIFYTTVVFFVGYNVCFFSVSWLAITYVKENLLSLPGYSLQVMDWNGELGKKFPVFMFGFFAVQALYLFGSVYFSKYAFIKTTILGVVLFALYVFYMSGLQSFLPKEYTWSGAEVIRRHDPNDGATYQSYSLSPFTTNLLATLGKWAWAPVFWLLTWVRLKEKEI